MTPPGIGAPVPITVADLSGPAPPLLRVNNAHAVELSLLTPDRLRRLLAHSFHARRIGTADAMLLAFDQDADYDSPNFLWFRARFARFVYVDRVVVAPEARRCGLARKLYGDLFARAAACGHDRVTCEVNADPPNPGSDAFHAALGFTSLGARAPYGTKTVRYLSRPLP